MNTEVLTTARVEEDLKKLEMVVEFMRKHGVAEMRMNNVAMVLGDAPLAPSEPQPPAPDAKPEVMADGLTKAEQELLYSSTGG